MRALVPQMLATMYAAPGIGLAAPQVGQGCALAVVDLQPDEKPAPIHLINPEIVARQRRDGHARGGLPVAARPIRRRVPARPGQGALPRPRGRRAARSRPTGLLAACLQHEIDHLDGVLFVDHLSALKRNMIMRRLAKELRQKSHA